MGLGYIVCVLCIVSIHGTCCGLMVVGPSPLLLMHVGFTPHHVTWSVDMVVHIVVVCGRTNLTIVGL